MTRQYGFPSPEEDEEDFLDTADYSNEDFSIHARDVIEEIEPGEVYPTSERSSTGSGGRFRTRAPVFNVGGSHDLVVDDELGARVREELGDPGELGRNESELARLPPGIQVRDVIYS